MWHYEYALNGAIYRLMARSYEECLTALTKTRAEKPRVSDLGMFEGGTSEIGSGVRRDPVQRFALAEEMIAECLRDGQSVRRVPPEVVAEFRQRLRALARGAKVQIRTAVLDGGAVAVVRTDSSIWGDDAATMRQKLQPPA